jgi:uncharacterized membrane protein
LKICRSLWTHLESVKNLEGDGKRSHWKAKAPLGQSVEWDAELTSDVGKRSYRLALALRARMIANSGVVEFLPTIESRHAGQSRSLTYEAPGGQYRRALIAKLVRRRAEPAGLWRFVSFQDA